MKNNNLSKTTIFTAITILFLSVIGLYLLIFLKIEPVSIGEQSYVGNLVTIMGVLITIIVGFQIYNIIDMRQEQKIIDKKMNEFKVKVNEERDNLKTTIKALDTHNEQLRVSFETLNNHSDAISYAFQVFANQFYNEKKYTDSIGFFLYSIYYLPNTANANQLQKRIHILQSKLEELKKNGNTLDSPEVLSQLSEKIEDQCIEMSHNMTKKERAAILLGISECTKIIKELCNKKS